MSEYRCSAVTSIPSRRIGYWLLRYVITHHTYPFSRIEFDDHMQPSSCHYERLLFTSTGPG